LSNSCAAPLGFRISFVIFWFTFLLFFPFGYTSMIFYHDFLVNAYFWILIGVLFRMPEISLSGQYAFECARLNATPQRVRAA